MEYLTFVSGEGNAVANFTQLKTPVKAHLRLHLNPVEAHLAFVHDLKRLSFPG